MGEIQEEAEGNGKDTGGNRKEWERYRSKMKGMGEIQEEAEGNGRDIGGN